MYQKKLKCFRELIWSVGFLVFAISSDSAVGGPLPGIAVTNDISSPVCNIGSFKGSVKLQGVTSVMLSQIPSSQDDQMEVSASSGVISPANAMALTVNGPIKVVFRVSRSPEPGSYDFRRASFANAATRYVQIALSLARNLKLVENLENGGGFYVSSQGASFSVSSGKLDSGGSMITGETQPCVLHIKNGAELNSEAPIRSPSFAGIE
jgi:hypothetical protein